MKKAEIRKMVDLQYIYSAMEILASAFDFFVNHIGINANEAINLFFVSNFDIFYEWKSPKYMVGISGRELALELLDSISYKYKQVKMDYINFAKSKEYWAMYMITYYKYKSLKTFREIFSAIRFSDLIKMYNPLHEAGFDKFIEEMNDIICTYDKPLYISFKDMRVKRDISQRELSDVSGINLRTLQKYETGEKSIENASYQQIVRLKRALSMA